MNILNGILKNSITKNVHFENSVTKHIFLKSLVESYILKLNDQMYNYSSTKEKFAVIIFIRQCF